MSQQAKRARKRLCAMQWNAWRTLPRELSVYGGFLAILAGMTLLARGWHQIVTARIDVRTVDSLGPYSYGASGPIVQISGAPAQWAGEFDATFGAGLVLLGGAALFTKGR